MSTTLFMTRIARAAERYAGRPALRLGGTSVSYRELFATAGGIRDILVQSGAEQARLIGIVTGDDVHTYAAILAVWSLGGAYVPLNVHNPPERNARVIDQARLDVVLTSRDPAAWPGHLPDATSCPPILQTTKAVPARGELRFPDPVPSDLAYIFFTSGSTGAPKGVPITHGNLSAFLDTILDKQGYGFTEADRFLQMFELTFDLSVVSILAPWSTGGCCCVLPEKGIAYMNVLKTLADDEVTVALMVPSVLPYLRRFFAEVRFPAMRLSQFCGEALMQDMVAEWSQCVPNATIENVYGPTEATIYCTRYAWTAEEAAAESVNGIVSIGRAMPGMHALVIDDEQQLCRQGVRGELCLAGHQVMSGYWLDREKTAESFVEVVLDGDAVRAYRTGDIAYVNERNNLIYCGRKDHQVKIDGHRVELGEIEHFARQFTGNSAVAAVVTREVSGTNRLTLFIGATDVDLQGLEQYLKANLPSYMWPGTTTVMPDLPLNLNGKIDRPALARLASK